MLDLNNVKAREAAWVAAGIAFMFAIVLSSCHHIPEPLPPLPGTPEAACANLARLKCPEAKTTRTGVTCGEVVRLTLKYRELPLDCIANAEDVDDVRACGPEAVRCEW